MHMRTALYLFIRNALLVSATAPAIAQAMPEDKPPALAHNNVSLEEVVVSARRSSEMLIDVPASIASTSAEQLQQLGIKNVADIQGTVPSLNLRPSQVSSQAVVVSIRGQRQVDINAAADNPVAIYLDGYNLPRAYGLNANLIDIDHVEVLRGPSGTLYGRNTTAGALSVFTKDPTPELGGSIQGTAGNFNARSFVGIANLPVTDNTAVRIVAQRGTRDGFGNNATGRDLANEDSTLLRGKWLTDFSDSARLILEASYQKSDTNGAIIKPAYFQPNGLSNINAAAALGVLLNPGGLAQALAIQNSYVGGNAYKSGATARSYDNFEGQQYGATFSLDLTQELTLKSLSTYQTFDSGGAFSQSGTPFDDLTSTLSTTDKFYSQELQLLGEHNTFNWSIGAFASVERGSDGSAALFANDVQSLNPPANVNPLQIGGDFENKSSAIYGQANWEILEDLTLTTGLRYSKDSREFDSKSTFAGGAICGVPGGGASCSRIFSKDFDAPSWLVSLSYKIDPDTMVYAKAAHGYRTGGWNLFASSDLFAYGPFQPEYVTDYEIGTKLQLWDHRAAFNFAAFKDDYTDIQRPAIAIDPVSGAPVSTISNAAKARIWGVEADLSVKVMEELTLSANFGLTDAKYESFEDAARGDRSKEGFGIPKRTYSINADFEHPMDFGKVSASLSYVWQSTVELAPELPDPQYATQPSYGLLNSRVVFSIASLNLDVALFGRNLTNKTYMAAASDLETSLGFIGTTTGAPRTYGIEVTKRFGEF